MYIQTCILYTPLVKYSFLEPISNGYTYKWSRCIRNFIYLREAFSKLAMEAINPLLIWHPTVLQHHRGLPRENIPEQVSDGNRLTHTWEPTGIIHYPLRICEVILILLGLIALKNNQKHRCSRFSPGSVCSFKSKNYWIFSSLK